jgi:hypothetical protein
VCIICLRTKIHERSSSDSLVIAVKHITKHVSHGRHLVSLHYTKIYLHKNGIFEDALLPYINSSVPSTLNIRASAMLLIIVGD